MNERDDKTKRSLSETAPPVETSPEHKRINSQSAAKIGDTKQEDLEEQTLLERVLERLPKGESEWQMTPFEQKRNIAGFKTRLSWTLHPREVHSVLKFSFANRFFNQMGNIFEGDLIVELEEVNFELPLAQKQKLQEKVEEILNENLQRIRTKGFGEEWRRQNEYLRGILTELSEELRKISESRKKCSTNKFDQREINRKHILYPAPATFAWNPLGNLCITENRYPTIRRPIIGEPSAVQKYFEASRQEGENSASEEQDENKQMVQGGKSIFYDWKVDEEVYLVIFNKQEVKIDQYSNSRTPVSEEAAQKREEEKVGLDNIDLGNLSRLSPKLKRAYERYFGGAERPAQFHRLDKLKVYDILSLGQQDEDDIVYLIERIVCRPQETMPSQIAFQNHFPAYRSLLNAPIDQLRYDILSRQLKQEITEPKISFGAFLRMFVLENDHFSGELEQYFKRQYRRLDMMPHPQIYGLGSYNKFDRPKAELIFMDLLKIYLAKTEEAHRVSTIGLHIRRRFIPSQLCIEAVVSQEQKDSFLRSLFPLLVVKDREMERFEFKKIKKIISANACITSFIKKLNQLVTKFEEGKTGFLKTVVEEFFSFRSDLKDPSVESHRYFLRTCATCRKMSYFYILPSSEQVQICHECKIQSFSQIF